MYYRTEISRRDSRTSPARAANAAFCMRGAKSTIVSVGWSERYGLELFALGQDGQITGVRFG